MIITAIGHTRNSSDRGSRMKITLIALALWFAPVVAMAQGFELTPFAQFGSGGNFDTVDDEGFTRHGSFDSSGGFGIGIDWVSTPDTRMGLYLSRQRSQYRDEGSYGDVSADIGLDIDYYHYEGKYMVRRSKRSVPYIEMSVGATVLRPESGSASGRFSFGIGGGLSYDLSPRVALRLDGRILTTTAGSYGAIACSPGFCAASVSGSYFSQFVAAAGLTFR